MNLEDEPLIALDHDYHVERAGFQTPRSFQAVHLRSSGCSSTPHPLPCSTSVFAMDRVSALRSCSQIEACRLWCARVQRWTTSILFFRMEFGFQSPVFPTISFKPRQRRLSEIWRHVTEDQKLRRKREPSPFGNFGSIESSCGKSNFKTLRVRCTENLSAFMN
jgi:hypothetical protein